MTARRLAAVLAAATLISTPMLVAPATGAQEAGAARPTACPVAKGARIKHDRLPKGLNARHCDLSGATVVKGRARAEVPPAGTQITATVLHTQGADELTVTTHADGTVEVEAEAIHDPGPAKAPVPTCGNAAAYSISNDNLWRSGNRFYVSTVGMPTGTTATELVRATTAASDTLERGLAPCGGYYEKDTVSLSMVYGGTTTSRPEIYVDDGDFKCDTFIDRKNVIGFIWDPGRSSNLLAAACSRRVLGSPYLSNADVAINAWRDFFTTMPSQCVNKLDLQGIITHELGHLVGLNHSSDYPQTMFPYAKYCCRDAAKMA